MSLMTRYYRWLCSELGVDPKESKIESVCSMMMISPFVSDMWEDQNIVESALYSRREFVRDQDPIAKREFYRAMGECSVLEVIAILIRKMSYMLLGNHLASSNQGALFFELLDNLGLSWINDDAFSRDEDGCREYIEDVMSRFVGREYEENGDDGGLFPLENPPEDMREMSLFQQLDAYLIEKYDALN